MNFTLRVWRQDGPRAKGRFVTYEAKDVSPDMSFMEMLDVLNEELTLKAQDPIAFDSDCREGICGACCIMINGQAHGGERGTTVCQLYMRNFKDWDTITIEPIRAKAFSIVKDLVVDRSAFDKIIASGGYVSVDTGSAPGANTIPIPKDDADEAMAAAACTGCGACVATCDNASAMLFASAKLSHLSLLPQGKAEWRKRVLSVVREMDEAGFGACSNLRQCEAACPKEIRLDSIARTNRQFLLALLLE